MFRLAQRMSRKSALRLADWLGDVFFRLFPKYRKVCVDGLTIAFGDQYTDKEKFELARKSDRNLTRTVMDFLRFGLYSKEELLGLCKKVEGMEHLEAAAAKSPGGVIGLGGHFGSWEYSGAWMVASGWPVSAVGKKQRDPGVTKLMLDQRARVGIKHILRTKKGTPEVVRAIRTKGTVLGLLSDQNGGWDGIFVDFFGHQASSVKGPAYLAIRYGVPVVPMFALWDGDYYRMEILPEVEVVRTGDEEADVHENTQRFQKVLEGMVRKYPDQWLWAHRRWKTRPPGEPPLHRH
jgi:KDO2-lipid IV(A) lauroyltransferase